MHRILAGKGFLIDRKFDFVVDHRLQSMVESIYHLASDMMRYTYSLDGTTEVGTGMEDLGQALRHSMDGKHSVVPQATTASSEV